jgi:hypothetical protein
MGFQALAYGCFLGAVLAIGDLLCNLVIEKHGHRQALVCWILLVSLPAALAGFISVQFLAMGLVFGCLLSGPMDAICQVVRKRFHA